MACTGVGEANSSRERRETDRVGNGAMKVVSEGPSSGEVPRPLAPSSLTSKYQQLGSCHSTPSRPRFPFQTVTALYRLHTDPQTGRQASRQIPSASYAPPHPPPFPPSPEQPATARTLAVEAGVVTPGEALVGWRNHARDLCIIIDQRLCESLVVGVASAAALVREGCVGGSGLPLCTRGGGGGERACRSSKVAGAGAGAEKVQEQMQ